MILLIDHRDSFTRNLEHLLAIFDNTVVMDRKEISRDLLEDSNMVVFSPGPGKPDDYPESIKLFHDIVGRKPILGICLGFQLILQEEGAEIIRQKQVLHGVETEIEIMPKTLTYKHIDKPLNVGRYHSLQVNSKSLKCLNQSIKITSLDPIRKIPLSFEDSNRKLFGLQYHPESFLTNKGEKIIQNIHNASLDKIGQINYAS